MKKTVCRVVVDLGCLRNKTVSLICPRGLFGYFCSLEVGLVSTEDNVASGGPTSVPDEHGPGRRNAAPDRSPAVPYEQPGQHGAARDLSLRGQTHVQSPQRASSG